MRVWSGSATLCERLATLRDTIMHTGLRIRTCVMRCFSERSIISHSKSCSDKFLVLHLATSHSCLFGGSQPQEAQEWILYDGNPLRCLRLVHWLWLRRMGSVSYICVLWHLTFCQCIMLIFHMLSMVQKQVVDEGWQVVHMQNSCFSLDLSIMLGM